MQTYTLFQYAILKHNNPYFAKESTTGENNYLNSAFALLVKNCLSDGSEKIETILYSDNLDDLTKQAEKFPSWYNYPAGKKKDLQGYISDLN